MLDHEQLNEIFALIDSLLPAWVSSVVGGCEVVDYYVWRTIYRTLVWLGLFDPWTP